MKRINLPVMALLFLAVSSDAATRGSAPLRNQGASLRRGISARTGLQNRGPRLAASAVPAALRAAAARPAAASKAMDARQTLQATAARLLAASAEGADSGSARDASGKAFDGTSGRKPGSDPVGDVNAAIAEILKPLNNKLTQVKVVIDELEVNDRRVVAAGGSLDYSKKGPRSVVRFRIQDISYSYPEGKGGVPVSSGKVSMAFNLLDYLSRAQINMMGEGAAELVQQLVQQKVGRYGEAVTVDSRVKNLKKDGKGNIEALDLAVRLVLNLAKLPAAVDPASVLLTEASLSFKLSLKGVSLAFKLVSNPKAKEFAGDQKGLKEYVDKLRSRDPEALEEIGQMVKQIDGMGDELIRYGTPRDGQESGGPARIKAEESAALEKAVASAQIPELLDYNRSFEIKTYPAVATPRTILLEITGWEETEDFKVLKAFKISSGDKAIKELAAEWRDAAKEQAENLKEKAAAQAYLDMAAALEKTFLGAAGFKSVRVAFHDVSEDGDTEFKVVLAQRQDGTWQVLSYQNFPF